MDLDALLACIGLDLTHALQPRPVPERPVKGPVPEKDLSRDPEIRKRFQGGNTALSPCNTLWHSSLAAEVATQTSKHNLVLLNPYPSCIFLQGPLASLGLVASLAAEAATQQLSSAGLLNLLHTRVSGHWEQHNQS